MVHQWAPSPTAVQRGARRPLMHLWIYAAGNTHATNVCEISTYWSVETLIRRAGKGDHRLMPCQTCAKWALQRDIGGFPGE